MASRPRGKVSAAVLSRWYVLCSLPVNSENQPAEVPKDQAERIFREFQQRRDAGESLSLGELCAHHPDLAGALRILHSLDGGPLDGSEAENDSGRFGANLLRGRDLQPTPQGETGIYCIRCGIEIGSRGTCPNPSCDGLPNFYRHVVKRPRRGGEAVPKSALPHADSDSLAAVDRRPPAEDRRTSDSEPETSGRDLC